MNREKEFIRPDLTMDLEMPLAEAMAENKAFCTRLTSGEYGKLAELFVLTVLTSVTDHDEFRAEDLIEAWVSAYSRSLTDRIVEDLEERGVNDIVAECAKLFKELGHAGLGKKGKDLILADMFEV